MGRRIMGESEQTILLLAVLHLRGQGYAVTIADEIERRTRKRIGLGPVYATLDRLQKKGFVSSRMGEPTPERGGKRKRYYRIEAAGERALSEARDLGHRMWAGAPLGVPA